MTDVPPLPQGFDVEREFPSVRRWNYLNHAAVAPISARAAAALREWTTQAEQDANLAGDWYKKMEGVRARAGRLINARADEIAFAKNTSEGIAWVANGLTCAGDEIISTTVGYPTMIYPWMDLAKRFGVRHVMAPERDGRIELEELLAAVTARTRMIALSHVEYASGFRHDLAAIGHFCRARGILLCVDAIQSCGIVPLDVVAMRIDFLSADGHKWLLAPEGCAIFYCRKELIARMQPEVGWMNVVNALDFSRIDFTLRPDARRFECGSHNVPGVLALGAALDLALEVGVDRIFKRVQALNDRLVDGLKDKGYRVISSRLPGETSGIVAFASDQHDHAALLKSLEERKIILALRDGRLRASPHYYTSTDQIDQLLSALP